MTHELIKAKFILEGRAGSEIEVDFDDLKDEMTFGEALEMISDCEKLGVMSIVNIILAGSYESYQYA